MILEIDWGNTRFKWRLRHESGTLAASGAEGAADRQRQEQVLAQLARPDEVFVASVRQEPDEQWLMQWVSAHWHLAPCFARPQAELGGVRCGYTEPARLGVDRWLALLAAWRAEPRAALVVQAGTALTADLLDDTGTHLGGYIGPGWQLMRHSLLGGTARVESEAELPRLSAGPGRDTGAAVEAALSAMALGLIRSAMERMPGAAPSRLILSGGDAEVLHAAYPEAHLWPNIVLDGLALACGRGD